jgi:DNA-binding transcriptional LysR family regulator
MISEEVNLSDSMEDEVLQLSECPVQTKEQRDFTDLLDKVNWHDLNIVRQVAEAGSLRKASRILNLSVNTIRARLDRLEKALATTLFARSRDGLRITAEGRTVLRVANDMRLLSSGLPMARGNHVLHSEGEVRICASEGVGTFWLTLRLSALKSGLPDHMVTLDCFSDQARVAPDGYDVSVGFQKPADLEAVCARIATIHVIPFASDQYIRQRGLPTSLDDLDGHQFIHQNSPGLNSDAINLFLSPGARRKLVAMQVSSSFSLYWGVVNGAGIAVLPTYARIITRRVRPINLPIQLRFELWLSYRREARQSEPVQKVVQWLRDSFDPQLYPWFADHFVHPDSFVTTQEDSQVVPLFDQLIGDE